MKHKRHNWTTETRDDGRCIDCGLRRLRVSGKKRHGCYGLRWCTYTIYRTRKGGQVWTPNLGNKVPSPCRPPREPKPTGVELVCSHCHDYAFPYQREGESCDRCSKANARIEILDSESMPVEIGAFES